MLLVVMNGVLTTHHQSQMNCVSSDDGAKFLES